MEMDSVISISDYYSRYGQLKFHDDSIPPPKKLNYSPTTSNSMIPPPQNAMFVVKLSPIFLNPRKRKFPPKPPKKKIKGGSSSIKEITKGSFEAAVKSSASVETHNRGVIKSSSWVKTRLLGEGSYGSVYLATNKNDKTERAIKCAELSSASTLQDEGRILTRLDSPFVIRCYGAEITREGTDLQYNLILEYCSGKSVTDMIIDIGGLSEFSVKLMAKDILSGLRYIHDRNIIHCDIKPDNLLLRPIDSQCRPNRYLTKIGDFGLAIEKGSKEYEEGWGHKRGTTLYMSPEQIRLGILDFGVDVWAFGCTILEMLTGQQVWAEYGDLEYDDWLTVIGFSDCIPHIPSSLSVEAQDFLKKCLVKEPNSRWGIQSLIDHPFLN